MNVSKSLLLPFSIVKSNVAERDKKAKDLTENFYQTILSQLEKNTKMKADIFLKETFCNVLPSKINIRVRNIKLDGLCNGILRLEGNNKFNKFILILNSDMKDIKALHLPLIIHEFQHLSDCLFNPKIIARMQICDLLLGNKNTNFYNKYLYNEFFTNNTIAKKIHLMMLRFKLKRFIKAQEENVRINILQSFRYNLLTELNAYKAEKHYAERLKANNYSISQDFIEERCDYFMFVEKINMINDLILEEIKRCRLNIRRQNLHKAL